MTPTTCVDLPLPALGVGVGLRSLWTTPGQHWGPSLQVMGVVNQFLQICSGRAEKGWLCSLRPTPAPGPGGTQVYEEEADPEPEPPAGGEEGPQPRPAQVGGSGL